MSTFFNVDFRLGTEGRTDGERTATTMTIKPQNAIQIKEQENLRLTILKLFSVRSYDNS